MQIFMSASFYGNDFYSHIARWKTIEVVLEVS